MVLSFNVAAVAALVPAVAQNFAVDGFLAGRIIWFYMLAYGLAALLYGPLSRTIEARRILIFCTAVFSLANLVSGLTQSITLLFIARLLAGVSGACIVPLALIFIAKNSQAGKRGRVVGSFFSFSFGSSLLGLFLSGVIPWRWIFLMPAIAAGFCPLAVYYFLPRLGIEPERFRMNYRLVLRDANIFRLFVYIFCISLVYHGLRQWLGVYYSKVYSLDQFLISMLLTTASLSGIIGESTGGLLADRFGRVKVINLGIILMIAAVFSLLLKGGLPFLFILMFVWGLGWTFNHAGVSTLLTDLPHEQLFESVSLNSSIRFLSGGLGVALGALPMQRSFNLGFMIFGIGLTALLIGSKKLIRYL